MRRTILLADDSVTIRKVVELTFSDTDIQVESVGTGGEALNRFTEVQPDLVLADVVMPEPSGYELCRWVKASSRPVPVLLLAGTFEPFDPDQAASCGADGHLVKPFDSGTLVMRVRTLLSQPPPEPLASSTQVSLDQSEELEAVLEGLVDSAPTDDPTAGRADAEWRPQAAAWPIEIGEWSPVYSSAGDAGESPIEGALSAEDAPHPEKVAGQTNLNAGRHRPAPMQLSSEEIDAVAREVVKHLSDKVLREIAWDVVPDLAEILIRERIRQLEREGRNEG